MTALPHNFEWLLDAERQPLPMMISEALAEYDTRETPGVADNPEILSWASETGLNSYTANSIPWCGLFMALIAQRAGKPIPDKPLWALNWAKFGEEGGQPDLGDVLVFMRDGGGHVGLYVAETENEFWVLGGNQNDRVSFTKVSKKRMKAVRQPNYQDKPSSARPYLLEDGKAVVPASLE